jgi:hypothetical protein
MEAEDLEGRIYHGFSWRVDENLKIILSQYFLGNFQHGDLRGLFTAERFDSGQVIPCRGIIDLNKIVNDILRTLKVCPSGKSPSASAVSIE